MNKFTKTFSAIVAIMLISVLAIGQSMQLDQQRQLQLIQENLAQEIQPGVMPVTPAVQSDFDYTKLASSDGTKDVLYDNGPLVTTPGGGAGGADICELQSGLGMNTLGGGFQITAGNSIADDFEVDATWTVETITFFGYQTGAGAGTSTLNDLRFQIYDSDPTSGGSVIWGDLTTNRLISSEWTNIYRVNENDPTGSTRAIMNIVGDATGLVLTPDVYWVEVTVGGTETSGPWCPPVTVLGQTTTGDAYQYVDPWQDWLDTGTLTGLGLPFIIEGTTGGTPLEPIPYLLASVVNENDVDLFWEQPGGSGEYIQWDDGINDGGLGLTSGGQFWVASHWTPADLVDYDGMNITKIMFYANGDPAATYELMAWTDPDAGTQIMSQPVTSFTVDDFNEIILSSPITINASDDLWFGYSVTHGVDEDPAGWDAGPAVANSGDMISMDGITFMSMFENFGAAFNHNWNLAAYVVETDVAAAPPKPMVKATIENVGDVSFSISNNPGMNKKFIPSSSKALLGYNIYRNGDMIDFVTETTYLDEDLLNGTYEYCVSVVYDEGESDQVCAPALTIGGPTIAFFDDFESGISNWEVTGDWGITDEYAYSPDNSLTDSPDGLYLPNQDTYATMANGVDLSDPSILSADVDWWMIMDIEGGNFDYLYLEVSDDNFTTYNIIDSLAGEDMFDPWLEYTYPLGAYLGSDNVKVRFHFYSDGGYEVDGCYIDDFSILTSDVDNAAPEIFFDEPFAYEGSLYEYVVEAELIDASGVATAEVSYTVEGIAQTNVVGVNTSGDNWEFTIPTQDPGSQVDFVITAVDASPNANEAVTDTASYIAGNYIGYDNAVVNFYTSVTAPGGTAVVFTIEDPSQLVTALIRNYTDQSQPPNDSMTVHVWADGGNGPGDDLIDPITIYPEANLVNTTAFTRVDLRPYEAQLSNIMGNIFVGFTVPVGTVLTTITQPGIGNHSFNSGDGVNWNSITDDYHYRIITGEGGVNPWPPPENVTAMVENINDVHVDWDEPGGGQTGSILCVDRDGSSPVGGIGFTDDWQYIEPALIANGFTFDYYEVEDVNTEDGPDLATMQQYDIIIWFCGEAWTGNQTMTDTDEANLATFLDGGGNLLLSAHDYLWDRYPTAGNFSAGQFPYDYLGVASTSQDTWSIQSPSTAEISGVTGSFAGGLTYTVQDIYTTEKEGLYIDQITSLDQDLLEVTSPTPSGIAACQYNGGTFKTAFTTVSIAAIVDPDDLTALMDNAVNWLSGNESDDLESYNVLRDGDLIANVTNTEYDDLDLDPGTYEYCVIAVYDDGESLPECAPPVTIDPTAPPPPPSNLETDVVDEDIVLNWEAPGNVWMQWDLGVNNGNGIGLSGAGGATFTVASHWDPASLEEYNGLTLTQIQFYANEDPDATFTIKVWTGAAGTNEVLSQDVASFTVNEWNVYDLSTPVPIDGTQDFWFGYEVTHGEDMHPAGCDDGPAIAGYGDMILWNGSWTSLVGLNPALDYNWNLAGYVEALDGTTELLGKVITPTTTNGTLVASGPTGVSNKMNTGGSKSLVGYNVYYSFDGGAFIFVASTTETTFTHEGGGIINGEHCYEVTAVYDPQGESDPTNESCEVITSVPEFLLNATTVYPNPASDVVNIKSDFEIESIRVYSHSGQIVADELINNTMYQLNTSEFNSGLYLFRIETSEGTITKRIIIQ